MLPKEWSAYQVIGFGGSAGHVIAQVIAVRDGYAYRGMRRSIAHKYVSAISDANAVQSGATIILRGCFYHRGFPRGNARLKVS